MLKLIMSDVDGTLVPDGEDGIPSELFETIRTLKARGIVFAVCSGRSYHSLKVLFEPVVDDIIFCCENGGYVKCRDYVIREHRMNPKDVRALILESRGIDRIIPCLCTPDCMYIERGDAEAKRWFIEGYKMNAVFTDDLLKCPLDHVIKFAVLDRLGVRNNAKKRFNPAWWERMHIAESGFDWLDFTDRGVTKGRAVRDIQNFLDIKYEETMVFGDNHNDIPMMKEAKYSFAVANARDEVKAVSNYRTASNTEQGVLKVLRHVLKGNYSFDELD
ncbi:MAG: HAD family hydrolase [Eubacteriales bacterium]|nr:HAD family hydrolase [Eubacteriales bacterium]